jgi:hypothetical protein
MVTACTYLIATSENFSFSNRGIRENDSSAVQIYKKIMHSALYADKLLGDSFSKEVAVQLPPE